MRVVWLREFGGPEVLRGGEAPDPVAGSGQVVVDVEFANITFVETQFRASGRGPFAGGLPLIPGNGVGGTVAATGSGVSSGLVGTRVVTGTGGSGGYAEQVAVDASSLFRVPDGLATDAAVALLADGRTATMVVASAAVRTRERVLVLAAAGGVGSLLVQLAASAGAVVVGAAGGRTKTGVVAELGASVVVDYLDEEWGRRVLDAVGGIDVVFDGVGGELSRAAFELLAPGGRMVSFGLASGTWNPVTEEEAAARSVALVRPSASADELRRCTVLALEDGAAGRLLPIVGQRFPLERAADAHAAIESRAVVGKTLLETR
jgi:NADPH2:quinone reductase